jgi:hypothetical protein
VPFDPKKEGTGKLNISPIFLKVKELVEEDQSSIREALYSLKIKLDKNFDKIDKYFDRFAERFDKTEELMAKRKNLKSLDNDVNFSKPLLNMVGVQFVDGNKPKVKTLLEPEIETESKNFLIEESSGKINFPRLSDINEEGLGKFIFPEELSKLPPGNFFFPKKLPKSPLVFLKKLSNSRIFIDLLSINQFVLKNSECVPGNLNFLQNWFIYWAEENIAEANCEGFFFFKILLLFFFDALALRVIRFTDFLYFYTMYWDPLL